MWYAYWEMSTKFLPSHIRQLIGRLNEDELHALHQIVDERLRLLHRAKALFAIRDFQTLDRVYFEHQGQKKYGTVIRLNQKTISVKLDNGEHWNVIPQMLKKTGEKYSENEIALRRNDKDYRN